MKTLTLAALVTSLLSVACCSHANALPPFKKAFAAKYTDKDKNPEYFNLVKKTGCDVCHVKKEKKDIKNAYGQQLAKLIKGDVAKRMKEAAAISPEAKEKEMKVILEELDKAFDKVAVLENKEKVKWGELIKQGKLPVPVAEAQEAAKKEAESKAKAETAEGHEEPADGE